MTKRAKINPRLAKIHRSYTIDEAARLILGENLARFLGDRRGRRRTKCGPGMIYCVGCRAPKRPAGGMVDCVQLRATVGDLRGLCPDCERVMHRRVSLARLDGVTADLDVRFQPAPPHLGETSDPTVDCHFKRGPDSDAKAQP